MDIDSIPPGGKFLDEILRVLKRSDVVLAMIGPTWPLRLAESGDFVRTEIVEAIKLGRPLLPVVLDAAPFPSKQQLPSDLHPMLAVNAGSLRGGRDFNRDAAILLDGLRVLARTDRDRALSQGARRITLRLPEHIVTTMRVLRVASTEFEMTWSELLERELAASIGSPSNAGRMAERLSNVWLSDAPTFESLACKQVSVPITPASRAVAEELATRLSAPVSRVCAALLVIAVERDSEQRREVLNEVLKSVRRDFGKSM